MKIKCYRFCIICILAVFTNNAYSARTYELFVTPTNELASMSSAMMDGIELKQHTGKIVGRVKYNSKIWSSLSDQEKISINLTFMDENIELIVSSINKNGKNYSYSASSTDSLDNINIAVSKGTMLGSFHYHGKLYKFHPSDSGDTVIIEMPSDMTEHSPGYTEPPISFDAISSDLDASDFTDSGAEYTVIVAYTESFARDAGDVDAYMDLLELETNQIYKNSNINTRMKIVHHSQTPYLGAGVFFPNGHPNGPDFSVMAIDLAYLSDTTRDETREFNKLRDQHNADVKIFMVGNDSGYGNFCGRANIFANESNALAVVKEFCGTGFLSFAHEIGHVFGALHAVNQDPSDEPYEFGHAYCDINSDPFRTVMGTQDCPSGQSRFENRIAYMSSPNLIVDNQVIGSEDKEDNVRVHNMRAAVVANFRREEEPNGIVDACQQGQTPVGNVELFVDTPVCLQDVANSGQRQMAIFVPGYRVGDTLEVSLSHGAGNGDLLHRYVGRPSRTRFDNRSNNPGNEETMLIKNVQRGWNYIHVSANTAFSGATLLLDFIENNEPTHPNPPVQIENACTEGAALVGNDRLPAETPVCLQDVSGNGQLQMVIFVPDDKVGSTMEILLSHGSGNATLLHRYSNRPSDAVFDHISDNTGNEERIIVENVQRSWNYIHVQGLPAFSGATLQVRFQ